jgi:hypothetical protein
MERATQRTAIVFVLVAATLGCSKEDATQPVKTAPPPPDPCGELIAFAWSCGIGRPERDPTVDLGTQRNNDLVIMQGVIDQCRQHRPPYDEGLLRCVADAHGSCATYAACADKAVAARASRDQ